MPRLKSHLYLMIPMRKYFQLVITLDYCTREEERIVTERGERISLRKPDPYMLDRIPCLIGKGFSECYYLGDMPDDMQAARSSKTGHRGVGVVLTSSHPENLCKELLQAGPEQIIDDYATLPEILGWSRLVQECTCSLLSRNNRQRWMASANLRWVNPIGFRNSSKSTSPGCVGMVICCNCCK